MILYAVYYLLLAIVFMFLEVPELWIAAFLVCANIYCCGHMIVKGLKK